MLLNDFPFCKINQNRPHRSKRAVTKIFREVNKSGTAENQRNLTIPGITIFQLVPVNPN
jgi:hypothetical protein